MSKVVVAYKDSVASAVNLPTTGNTLGDVRTTRDTAWQYYWDIVAPSGSADNWVVLNERSPDLVGAAGSGSISASEKAALEMELSYKFSNPSNFKEMAYNVSDQLINVDTYTDSSKATQLYALVLTYSGDQLTQSVLTRNSDSATLTKDLIYSGDQLASLTRTLA